MAGLINVPWLHSSKIALFQQICNFANKETSAQLFPYKFFKFSGRLLLSIAVICQEHFIMWEQWELRYSDHLPPHFKDLGLTETESNISIYQTACKNKIESLSHKCTSNRKMKFITFFIWPRGTLENIFKVES